MPYSIDQVFSRFSRVKAFEGADTASNSAPSSADTKNTAAADRIAPPEQKFIATKEWINETREKNLSELQKMLQCQPKNTSNPLIQLKPIARNLCSQGVGIGLFYIAGGLLNRLGFESSQFSQVGLYALGDLLKEQKVTIEDVFIDRLFGSQDQDAQTADDRSAWKMTHKRLLKKEIVIPETFSDNIKFALDAFDKKFTTDSYADGPRMRAQLFAREGLLKAIPTYVQDVSHQSITGNIEVRAQIDKRVKELVGRYPLEMQSNLRSFIARIRANCFKNVPQFAGAYLYGKPGTGKTYFAKNLAKALNLPLLEFSLNDVREEVLMGNNGWSTSMTDDSISREEFAIGKLACSVIKSGILNPIIYFDEGGDNLHSVGTVNLLKRLLDPEGQRKILYALGGAVLDFSRVTFMISGNDPLENAALKRRIKEIEFGSLPLEAKKLVISEEIAQKITNHSNLSADIFCEFEKHVSGSFDEIVRQDSLQKSPGVAVAQQVIEDVVNYVTDVLLAAEAIDSEELNKVIEDGFAQRLPRIAQ